jgi:hypothetical protein
MLLLRTQNRCRRDNCCNCGREDAVGAIATVAAADAGAVRGAVLGAGLLGRTSGRHRRERKAGVRERVARERARCEKEKNRK